MPLGQPEMKGSSKNKSASKKPTCSHIYSPEWTLRDEYRALSASIATQCQGALYKTDNEQVSL